MAATSFSGLGLFLLLFLGTPLNVPLSLPPLPEDPVLARMAPEQCVWYLSLAGVDKANPASKNKVEQLLSEDDVRRFLKDLSSRLKASFVNATRNDPRGQVIGAEGPKLVETLLTRPMCTYIGSVAPGPRGPAIRGGLAVNLGDDAAATKASLEKLDQSLLPPGAVARPDAADGWHTLPMPSDAPTVQWAIKEKYLIVGVGDGEGDALWARRSKSAPDWLTNLRRQLTVERPSMVSFLNVQTIAGMAQAAVAGLHGPEQTRAIFEGLGLHNVKYYASVSGLDQESYSSRAIVATDGQPTGLLSLVGNQPLSAESLSPIPADSSFALAARLDANKVFEAFVSTVALFEPRAQVEIERGIDQMSKQLGVHLKNDLLAALGDTWCVYNSPGDGGLVFTGLTVTATIRDRAKLVQALDKLVAFARAGQAVQGGGDFVPARPRRGAFVAETEFRGQKIQFVNFVGEESPFAPAWCITDKQVLFALFPQTLKAYLERQQSPSLMAVDKKTLATVPEVARQFSSGTAPTALVYQDTPSMFKLLYPLAQVFAQFLSSELQRQGVDLDIGMLPNARAIGPHLTPSVSTMQITKDGIRIDSRGTLPTGIGALPLASVGVLLPATFSARHAAGRNQSMNNLKQIALAMHNHLDVHRSFPSATGAEKGGKPLLSWRVRILPFLEEGALFNEFKLDEPWDSDHNKKLIERIPAIYEAPGSQVAGEFKTVYLAPRGENTIIHADKPVQIKHITDGTSKTIMVVEASDDKAVIWTKPDDFEPDEQNPIAGLVGLQNGGFLAAFADGHVSFFPQAIAAETLKALFSRNGGEAINDQF